MKRILLTLFLVSSLFSQGNDRYNTYISTWYDAIMMATDTTFNGIAGGQYMQDGRGNLSIFSIDGTNNRVGFGKLSPAYTVDVSGTLFATTILGDGSGLTGIGSGTGGVINTGSTTIGADSDVDGVGEIAFQTRGVTRATINNSGDFIFPLLLGGTSTTQDLSFKTTSGAGASGADMHFLVGNDGATEAMTILNSGNVGIGTASPQSELHAIYSRTVQPRGLTSENIGNNIYSGTVLLRKARGTIGSLLGVLQDDSIGNVSFSGHDSTGYQEHQAIIQAWADENFVYDTNYGSRFTWQLIKNNTGYTPYEAMRLTNAGYLGIGDTNPLNRLTVKETNAAALTTPLVLRNASSDVDTEVAIGFSSFAGGEITGSISNLREATTWALVFSTWGSALEEKMRILGSNGNVGIGTTVPVNLLNVDGAYNFFADSSAVNDSWGFSTTGLEVLTTGMSIYVQIAVANTDGATLQINALGAKAVNKLHDQALITGDVEAGQILHLVYDGTNFQMLSQLAQ